MKQKAAIIVARRSPGASGTKIGVLASGWKKHTHLRLNDSNFLRRQILQMTRLFEMRLQGIFRKGLSKTRATPWSAEGSVSATPPSEGIAGWMTQTVLHSEGGVAARSSLCHRTPRCRPQFGRKFSRVALLLSSFFLAMALHLSAAEQKKVDFETQILPILKRNCLACHNATDAKGDLVLETPETIMKGGENGAVVVPKKGAESSLLTCSAKETKPFMPPKDNKVGAEMMKPDELALLKAWIDQGATGTVTAKTKPVQWKPLPPGNHPILAITVTGDGQFAACGRANQIFIYHIPTGQIVARLTDPKLAEKTGRSGYRSSAQRDFVQSLAFSPDGRLLASGEYRMVKLWQREPNLPQFTLGADPVSAFAASADGKWIATAAKDNVIRIWDAASGKPVKELPGHTGTVNALKFSQDSTKLASGSADKTIRVWEVAAGKLFSQTETAGAVHTVAWAMAGKQIASAGGEPAIRLWELPAKGDEAWKPLKEFAGHTGAVTSLESLAPDGKQMLSGSVDGSVRHWSVEQHRQIRQFDHGAPVTSVAVAPNGKTFASAGGNFARLWSAEKGQQLAELKGDHRARARIAQAEQALAFAKNEIAYWKTASETAAKTQAEKTNAVKKAVDAIAAAEKTIAEKKAAREKITDDKAKPAADDAVKSAEAAKTKADTAIDAAKLSAKQAEQAEADAKAASEKAAASLQQYEAAIADAKKAAAETEKPIRAIAFAPGNLAVATAGDDQIIQTWSTETGAGFDTFPSQLGPVQALAFAADGRIVASAAKNGAVVWRSGPNWTLARTIGTGDEKSPLIGRVIALDFSADGQLLATGGGVPSRSGEVKIWRASDSSLVREITPSHSDTVFGLDFSPDGKFLATASADKFVKVFETASGKLFKQLAGHTHYVLSVGWRADGRTLASSGADKAVKLWSFPGGEQLKTVEGFRSEVTSVRFVGLGGEMLATSGDTKVRLLKEDGTALRDFAGGKGFIFSATVTPDGQTILGGGQDSVLRIWNATTAKTLLSLEPPPKEIPVKAAKLSSPK
jgi:WD40 repeat protein